MRQCRPAAPGAAARSPLRPRGARRGAGGEGPPRRSGAGPGLAAGSAELALPCPALPRRVSLAADGRAGGGRGVPGDCGAGSPG